MMRYWIKAIVITGALPLLLPFLLVVIWIGITHQQIIPSYLLPSPWQVCLSLQEYALGNGRGFQGRLWGDMSASFFRVFTGFGLACSLGLLLGLLSGRHSLVARALSPLINALRAVPGICWLPLCLLWLGIGYRTTLFLITLAAFFPIYLNTVSASASVPDLLIRSGRMLGFSGTTLLREVIIPWAMPQILAGMRLGLGISYAYLVLGELTGVSDGVGAMIMDARAAGRVDMVLCGILILSIAGWLTDLLFRSLTTFCFKSIRRR